MIAEIYSAGLVSQSFWFVELKKMIELVSEGVTKHELRKMCIDENLFGASKQYRAKRMFGYIYNRVSQLDKNGIALFISSDLATQKLINLICILRQDRLFFEFINEVYREKVIIGVEELSVSDLNIFFKDKEVQSEVVAMWTDATKKRIGSCYFNFLTDANLLTLTGKSRRITPPLLDIALERYLEANNENAILKAITGVF